MANNYPPPFFGFPAEYMPQPAMNRQPQHEQMPANNQNAPAPPPFPNIPGLQHHSSPSVNPQAQSPTGYQSAFTHNILPSQLPPNWAALMPYIQNGTFPLPPFPGFPMPSAPPVMPPPMAQPPQTSQNSFVASETRHEGREGDRNQGKVMGRDAAEHNPVGGTTGQVHSEPQSNAPQSTGFVPAQELYNPDQPAAGQAPSLPNQMQQQVKAPDANKHQKNKEEVRQFIKLLNSNNIGYGTLSKEDLDNELLRGLYQSLNLPSEPAPIPPPKPATATSNLPPKPPKRNTVEQAEVGTAQRGKNASASNANANTNSSTTTKPAAAASPAAGGDRKDYIARLQAAKLAKQANTPKPSPPQQSPASANTPQPEGTPPAKQRVSDEERARNTALIKARLDAINAVRAKQKQQSVHTNGTSTPVSEVQQPRQPVQLQQDAQSISAAPVLHSAGPGSTSTKESSFPGIPGLFMNPTQSNVTVVPSSKPQLSVLPETSGSINPAATPTPRGSVTPYSRSVQRSPYVEQDESMIIEVSDDESAGSEMDIDDDLAPQESVAIPPRSATPHMPQPTHIPNGSSRNGSARPASSAVSTPGPQTPSSVGREKELEGKEKQLAAMKLTLKRKLAEKRARDQAAAEVAAAASSANASSSSTPAPPTNVGNGVDQVARSNEQVDAGSSRVATLVTPDSTRQSRRAEIQSRLPSLDSDIASNSKRIAQLTREMEQLVAHNERMAKDKEDLTKELEELGIDTEGMSHAELRATKDAIGDDALKTPDVVMQDLAPTTKSVEVASTANAPTMPQQAIEDVQTPLSPPRSNNEKQASARYAVLPGLGKSPQQPRGTETSPVQGPTVVEADSVRAHDTTVNEETAVMSTLPVSEGATPLDDDDFYSPPPPVQKEVLHDTQAVAVEAQESSPSSEEGEVEMSESEEEEYDPEISVVQSAHEEHPVQLERGHEVDSETLRDQQQNLTRDEEEDYEPPDVDDATSYDGGERTAAPLSGAYPGEDEGAMDIVTSSDDDSDDGETNSESDSDNTDSESDEEVEQVNMEQRLDEPAHADSSVTQSTNVPFDIVSAVQPPADPVQTESDATSNDQVKVPAFSAYESPLRFFKSYRYHPSYMQDVAGGFLSWTFSHQIDPQRTLCQFEGAGGVCNDPACPDQHFRDFGLTGDKLLLQLGTANPGKTEEEKKRWNDGLRGVLQELRKQNIKEPDGIAMAIAKYRREFFHDPTRVVNL